MNKQCLKCNSEVKESPYNNFTGYKSYRCTNKDCNSLFDLRDLTKSEQVKNAVDRMTMDSQKRTMTTMNLKPGMGKSNTISNHILANRKSKVLSLRSLFGDRLVDIIFKPASNMPRNIHSLAEYQQLSSGEKVIADLFVHLYNPALVEWPLSNLNLLDQQNKNKVLHIINNYDRYTF